MVVTNNFTDVWLYMIAPIVGAIIAAVVHRALTALSKERTTAAAGRAAEPAE